VWRGRKKGNQEIRGKETPKLSRTFFTPEMVENLT
jgi:hypothetical protein